MNPDRPIAPLLVVALWVAGVGLILIGVLFWAFAGFAAMLGGPIAFVSPGGIGLGHILVLGIGAPVLGGWLIRTAILRRRAS